MASASGAGRPADIAEEVTSSSHFSNRFLSGVLDIALIRVGGAGRNEDLYSSVCVFFSLFVASWCWLLLHIFLILPHRTIVNFLVLLGGVGPSRRVKN